MSHTLILGVTESGKSTYAKWVCSGLRKRGIKTLVLNPYNDPTWEADEISSDPAYVFWYAQRHLHHAIFLEESGDALQRDPLYDWFTCRARHWGHKSFVITQRLQDVRPALRNNCTQAVVFASETMDCRELASRYREPILLNVEKFRPGQCIIASQFADALIGQLDWKNKRIIAGPVKR